MPLRPLLPMADMTVLPRLVDLSDSCVRLLRFVYGDALALELMDARWADEIRIWAAVRLADRERLLGSRRARTHPVVIPDPPPTGGRRRERRYRPLVQLIDDLMHEPALQPMDESAKGVTDPSILDYGEPSAAILVILRRGTGLDDYEVAALADLVPDVDADLRALLASAREYSPAAEARIRLVMAGRMPEWASPMQVQFPWAVALATLVGTDDNRVTIAWRDVVLSRDGAAGWYRSILWEPPTGHPSDLPDNVDFGPNRSAIEAFYERSANVSKAEVVALAEAWTDAPWRRSRPGKQPPADRRRGDPTPYGRVRDIGTALRPTAYAIARLLGHMRLPQAARLAIKDAAAALVLADLIDDADREVMSAAWHRAMETPSESP